MNMAPIRIIGIGSPFGDDQVGWKIIKALEQESSTIPVSEWTLARCDSPSNLLSLMKGAKCVYLIDAVQTGATPGTIHHWQGEEIINFAHSLSSHGIDVASVIALGKALAELPPTLILYGIELSVETITPHPETIMSTAVTNAIPVLLSLLKKDLKGFYNDQDCL